VARPRGRNGLATSLLVAGAVIAWRTGYTALVALHTGPALIAMASASRRRVRGVRRRVFALSLHSIRPRTLWYTLRALPRHLIDLFRTFHTCDRCRVHYRNRCDGCGRTPDEPAKSTQQAA
jgi:hypothetical protein